MMMKKHATLRNFALLCLCAGGLLTKVVNAGGFVAPAPKPPQAVVSQVVVARVDTKPAVVVKPVVKRDPIVSGTMKLHPFNRIAISGPFDVELVGNMPTNDLRYVGNDSVIQRINVQVRNNTLYVGIDKKDLLTRYRKSTPKQALVIIRAGLIEDLYYAGNGTFSAIGLTAPYVDVTLRNQGPVNIQTQNLHLHYLDVGGRGPVTIGDLDARNLRVLLRGSNHINLKGRAMVENVVATGKCYISMDQLDTPFLRVRGRQGAEIHLSGSADVMEAFLYDGALFDGQNLLVRKAFVKTFDKARADIQVSEYQSTLASDNSNIFYYRKATHHGDYMHHSGSVLQIADYSIE